MRAAVVDSSPRIENEKPPLNDHPSRRVGQDQERRQQDARALAIGAASLVSRGKAPAVKAGIVAAATSTPRAKPSGRKGEKRGRRRKEDGHQAQKGACRHAKAERRGGAKGQDVAKDCCWGTSAAATLWSAPTPPSWTSSTVSIAACTTPRRTSESSWPSGASGASGSTWASCRCPSSSAWIARATGAPRSP